MHDYVVDKVYPSYTANKNMNRNMNKNKKHIWILLIYLCAVCLNVCALFFESRIVKIILIVSYGMLICTLWYVRGK